MRGYPQSEEGRGKTSLAPHEKMRPGAAGERGSGGRGGPSPPSDSHNGLGEKEEFIQKRTCAGRDS